jgi:ectoine hydroxylase-related dioxygenase (phytanoyl-CoA dioxygenase family)
MIRKAPRDEEPVPFHQDEAYWNPWFDYRSLGVWTPLDPATVESGCMSMVPGSHLEGIRTHALRNDDPTVTLIDMVDPPVERAVPQPVPIGGASFHHCRTIHGSGPNVSDHPRRVVIAEWQAAPVRREAPKDHPWFWPRHEARQGHCESGRDERRAVSPRQATRA